MSQILGRLRARGAPVAGLAASVFLGCGGVSSEVPDSPPTAGLVTEHWARDGRRRVTVLGREGVVLGAPELTGTDEQEWAPTDADLVMFEEEIGRFLESELPGSDLAERQARYIRQYVGFGSAEDKRLFVSLMCEAAARWEHRYVSTMGGGDCYFSLMFDPSSGAFSQFHINGPR